jgi:hypothetical protein
MFRALTDALSRDEIMADPQITDAKISEHSHLKKRAARTGVILDMVRSHVAGEHLLPTLTAGYVTVGAAIVAGIAGVGVTTASVATLLLGAVVVVTIIAALAGEMEEYVDWRAAHDPAYERVRRELYPRCGTR